MKTVGETLQTIRIKRGLSLEEISHLTKIKPEFLQAIEAGEFSTLPSPVSVQGFITSYAGVLGIEPNTALSLLRRDYSVTRAAVLPKQFDNTDTKKRRKSKRGFAILLFFLGCLVVITYFLWGYRQLNQPPKLTVTSPKNGSVVNSTFVVRGWTASDAKLEIDGQPVSLTQDGEFAQEVALSEGDHTVTVIASNRRKQETIQQLLLHVE